MFIVFVIDGINAPVDRLHYNYALMAFGTVLDNVHVIFSGSSWLIGEFEVTALGVTVVAHKPVPVTHLV